MSLWRLNFLARSRRFARAERGNVAMLWALCGAALIGLTGLTVDFTRAQSIRAQMQNAADGAVLVAERMSNEDLQDRKEAAEAFYDAELGDLAQAAGATFDVIPVDTGGHRVTASYTMPLSLARIIKNEDWVISVASEAEASASPPIEVALVLDNTGSMSNDMDGLRDAAEDLADYLLGIDGDSVSVALVPFVAQVNIGTTHMNWMDQAGTNPHHGEWFEDRLIATRPDSNGNSSGGNCNASTSATKYPATLGPYPVNWVRTGNTCYAYQSGPVNVFTLYANLPSSAAWGGCVEARPPPYDINDAAPSTGTPATMFVPYFWPDEGGDDTANNNWLTENTTNVMGLSDTTGPVSQATSARTFAIYKYRTNATVSIVNTSPNQRGPNRGCPTPIVPLTTSKNTVITAIQNMKHWNGGGTNQAEGLAWGWRVLSPTAPFTEGRDPAQDDVRKVLVMMTDGENTSLDNANDGFVSDYSSYQFRRLWTEFQTVSSPTNGTASPPPSPGIASSYRRNGITNEATMVNYINTREELLCTAIKNADIEIYTIQFRDTNTANRNRLRNCASSPDNFFSAANAAQLKDAFDAIGSGIGNLRLTH